MERELYVKKRVIDFNSLLDAKEDIGQFEPAVIRQDKNGGRQQIHDNTIRSTLLKTSVKPEHYPDLNKSMLSLLPLLGPDLHPDRHRVVEYNYLQYNKGDFFTRHRDVIEEDHPKLIRRFSTTTLISESDDFEGGEFLLWDKSDGPSIEIKLEAGETLLFESTKVHEVKPVTKGTREALISWIGIK
jgi:Rps23 Pro-64 3,4-dihydroxylase Tpa1-like proline 4-hydroxylase